MPKVQSRKWSSSHLACREVFPVRIPEAAFLPRPWGPRTSAVGRDASRARSDRAEQAADRSVGILAFDRVVDSHQRFLARAAFGNAVACFSCTVSSIDPAKHWASCESVN